MTVIQEKLPKGDSLDVEGWDALSRGEVAASVSKGDINETPAVTSPITEQQDFKAL